MQFLTVNTDYTDPSAQPTEAVERKGVGHPDSLADALANEVSVAFSRHCLDRFGVILHHNVDKLYIGAGDIRNGYGTSETRQPIIVQTNGRISDIYGTEHIDIESIQRNAVWNYLSRVLPRLTQNEVTIIPNATQRHRVTYRYKPKDKSQIPHTIELKANDTSYCVSHWPPTITESITYRLERYFWEDRDGYAVPRFQEVGQDIKVFVLRHGKHLEITVCMPTISVHTRSHEDYCRILTLHESRLRILAQQIANPEGLAVSLHVNQYQEPYMLGIGSCVECGEEGIVGRGNDILGIISSNRAHTKESWAGKNPVYHTGRVMSYLTLKLARALSSILQLNCSVAALTQCGGTLIPPSFLNVSLDRPVSRLSVEAIVESELLATKSSGRYIEEILCFRPWMLEL